MKRFLTSVIVTGLVCASCFGPADTGDTVQSTSQKLAIAGVSLDYTAAGLSVIDLDSSAVANELLTLKDPFVTFTGGYLFVLDRLGFDNLYCFAADQIGGTSFKWTQHFTGAVNIQDIAVVGDGLAVMAQLNSKYLAVLNIADGSINRSIDISAYADPAGNDLPCAARVAAYNGKAYVFIQRLDAAWATTSSSCLVVDPATGSVTKEIVLNYTNPISICQSDSFIYVASAGSYGSVQDGGVEMVDCQNDTAITITSGKTLQGNPTDIAVSNGFGYVVVGAADYSSTLKRINIGTGSVSGIVSGLSNPTCLATDGNGTVFVGDRGASSNGIGEISARSGFLSGSLTQVSPLPFALSYIPPVAVE